MAASHQPLHRPSSPTELSYTQLVKLAPPIGQRRKNGISVVAGLQTPAAALASVPTKLDAPRTAPPASISVPSMFHSNNAAGGLRHQTPAQTSQPLKATAPMSAPLQNATRPTVLIPPQQGRSQNPNDAVGYQYYSMPLDDRVSSLAMKLQAMQTTPSLSDQFHSSFTPTLHHSQQQQQQQQQQRSNDRLNEIHQFIDTLKNMQQAVSRTADEQQRVKKSRALNALLSMFERIIEDHSHTTMERVVVRTDPSLELSVTQLEQRIQQLEGENQHLRIICREKDAQLHQRNDELHCSHRELQRLTETNQQLQSEVMQIQEQCHQEAKRASEAESVANEAENVRNGLLANYARLSEENVEMQREVENVKLENNKMVTEFEYCQQEITHLQEQCGELTQQLQRKGTDVIELEKAIVDLNDQLAAQRNALQSANADRQRLQGELHAAQRNSTAASEQLMKLRNQFSQVRRENDSKRHHQLTQESEYHFVRTKLQEEQRRRRELERSMLRQQPLSSRCEEENGSAASAATDELRRIASANAELKKKVDGLTSFSSRQESSATNRRFDKDDLSLVSRAVSSIDSGKGLWESKVETSTSRSGFPSNASKPRSEVLATDEFSLTEVDSIARGNHLLRNGTSVFEHTQNSKPAESTTENAHPNLMDYFYSQINRAE